MQKSLYDQSTLTWSPQGRLYQVEYAMEAVNQGNLLIGVKSNTHVVLIKRKIYLYILYNKFSFIFF